MTQQMQQTQKMARPTSVTTPAADQSQPHWQNSNGMIDKPGSTETTVGRCGNDFKIESERALSSDPENDDDFCYEEVED